MVTNLFTSMSAAAAAPLVIEPVQALYVHVPFCASKCRYCDFYSMPNRSAGSMEQYVAGVLQEASWWTRPLAGTPLKTIFFGGGTPTVLPMDAMRKLVSGLRSALPIAPDAEWTVEANPATADLAYCHMLMDEGVNRLSIGAQSFIPAELATLGRIHSADAIGRFVEDAHNAGFRRISIDLMYALPGQTPESWQTSLAAAVALGIGHLSCYCLTLEESTPMWEMVHLGKLPAVDDDVQLRYMKQTRAFLRQNGFLPYEISNYALSGEECRHNLHYWNCDNYLGFGPGAASHIAGQRWRNAPDICLYLSEISRNRVPLCDVECLKTSERVNEMTMMMLRTAQGIDRKAFARRIGQDAARVFGHALDQLISLGLINLDEQHIALTDAGMYVADEVICELVREID